MTCVDDECSLKIYKKFHMNKTLQGSGLRDGGAS